MTTIPVVSGDLQLRFTITDTYYEGRIDINDPQLNVRGSIIGDSSAMVANATRWTIVVNGQTVANNDASAIGSFDLQIPIGHVLDSSDSELEIKIKAWYNWGNDGAPSTLSLRTDSIESLSIPIEYDEDPVCSLVHTTYKRMRLILPLLSRCQYKQQLII